MPGSSDSFRLALQNRSGFSRMIDVEIQDIPHAPIKAHDLVSVDCVEGAEPMGGDVGAGPIHSRTFTGISGSYALRTRGIELRGKSARRAAR
jgi:hypothetical protein